MTLSLCLLELVSTWRLHITNQENQTEDERELIMNLSPAYLQWRENTLREGRQEGLQEGLQTGIKTGIQAGKREVVENLLRAKFGTIDEALSSAIALWLQLPPEEFARLQLQLANLSREELLARLEIRES